MQGLFSCPFDNLDENDLHELVEIRRVREHIQLDYKQQPYAHNHSDTVEMLADVTAMANAQGGYILIGVEEDDSQSDGTPKRLSGIANGDIEANWIQNVCISSVDEKITALRVRDIPLANGLSCVIIQIPNSLNKPHMVVHEKHRSFRMRHGRDKSFMNMQEVKNMILSTNAYRASLAAFIESRKRVLRDDANGVPWLLLMATPVYVDTDKIDPLRRDIRDLLTKAPGVPDPKYYGIFVGTPKPTIFGVEAGDPETRPPQPYIKVLRLFRNGHFEFCESHAGYIPKDWPQQAMPLYSYRAAVSILHFLIVARQVFNLAELHEPIAVTAHWKNFDPSYLYYWKEAADRPYDIRVWRGKGLTIDFVVNDLSDPISTTRLIIDRLFHAFGYENDLHFDAQGNFTKL